MIRNFIIIALRNLRKRKGYAFINVAGLTVGLTCCLLILLYVQDELGYDSFHEKADQIFRTGLDAKIGDRTLLAPLSPSPLAEALVRDFPEVKQATRIFSYNNEAVVRRDNDRIIEKGIFFADSTFFDVFTFPLLQGNPKTVLSEPNRLVLTQSMVEKYFGAEDPMGQTLELDGADYQITGVIEDVPAQSHFHFDMLGSMVTLQRELNNVWVSNNFYTYLVLEESASPDVFIGKLNEHVMEKYVGPQVQQAMGLSVEDFRAAGGRFGYFLQPLQNIHLHSQLSYEIEPNGNITYLYAFSAIALLILIIACINFMNLATARSAERSKEVGVRKVLGSSRAVLMGQFLSEAVILSALALILSFLAVEALLPAFNQLAGKELTQGYLGRAWTIPFGILLVLVIGLMAGSYPAFVLSSFRPVTVLKGAWRSDGRGAGFRSLLVVFQFAVSVILIVCTGVVYQQMQFVQQRTLGFDREHVVVLERAESIGNLRPALRERILQMPGVQSASFAADLPGAQIGDHALYVRGKTTSDMESIRQIMAGYEFDKTLRLSISQGRFFSRDFPTDSTAIVLNQKAVQVFGLENPVGVQLIQPGLGPGDLDQVLTIVGVVEDFHFESLHKAIEPLAIYLRPVGQYLTIRLDPGNTSNRLESLRSVWDSFETGVPFTYSFLDARYDALYGSEQRIGQLFTVFSTLAILIACLGLFGLATFMAQKRTKELGIRKVLGASAPNLVVLLSKDFTRLVLIAFVVAAPVAWYVMRQWLSGFAYHIDVAWWLFPVVGVLALCIAWLSVSFQSIKAALNNPVKSLRYE